MPAILGGRTAPQELLQESEARTALGPLQPTSEASPGTQSPPALPCPAAQPKDTKLLLLLLSQHLRYAEHTSPKVPGILT